MLTPGRDPEDAKTDKALGRERARPQLGRNRLPWSRSVKRSNVGSRPC